MSKFQTSLPSGKEVKVVLHKYWKRKQSKSRTWKTIGSKDCDFRKEGGFGSGHPRSCLPGLRKITSCRNRINFSRIRTECVSVVPCTSVAI